MLRVFSSALTIAGVAALSACSTTPTTNAEAPPAMAPATPIEVADSGAYYPRKVSGPRGSAEIYAPQIESWKDFERLSAWLAFSVTASGSDETYVGSLKFSAQTEADLKNREVLLHDLEVEELHIEGLDSTAPEFALIEQALTSRSRKIPLDLVLEHLPEDLAIPSTTGLSASAPPVFYSDQQALLLAVDGEPLFVPVEGAGLEVLLNTPWDILRDTESASVFLCYESSWLVADALDSEWRWAESLPSATAGLPDTQALKGARACLPDDPAALSVPSEPPPLVFYTTEQAELLLTDGDPSWEVIGETKLAYASNSAQDLFRYKGAFYVLFSGRWFIADALSGAWERTQSLPAVFAEIPSVTDGQAHEMSHVRASVPGTPEANEAAIAAVLPRKADILRGSEDALALDVTYAGEPVFVPIEQTGIDLATNTSYQVLRYEDAYYLCHNATWLISWSPTGPWLFADQIPDAFSLIPPSSPAYNTTFVRIDDSTDESVSYSYTAGYENAYVDSGAVVYGTGYDTGISMSFAISMGYYSGWPYYGYPYYWWPPTYGWGSWYDPGTGRYGEAIVGYGPYGAAGGAAVYNPQTGVYGRGRGVWDNDEFAGRGFAYNPNTDTSIARNRYIDFEDNEGWSERVARRGDEWRYTRSEWEDGRMVTDFTSSRGTEGSVARQRDGDTLTSEGVVRRGEQAASFETVRQRDGDALVSEGSITGDERSANFQSVIEDGTYQGNIQGSEGGSGSVNRELDNGEITGSGSFSRNDKTIETDVTRNAEGVQRQFETGSGGQGVSRRSGDQNGFVYQSGSGEIYAGRDGQVYQKGANGWSPVRNSGSTAVATGRGGVSTGSFGTTSRSTSAYPQLDRDFQSRQRGYSRYNNRSRAGAMQRRGGLRGRRR